MAYNWDSLTSLFTNDIDLSEEGGLDKYIKAQKAMGYGKNIAGSFSDLAGAHINYSALKGDLQNLRIQADGVELAAKQQANQIREQFIQTAANYTYNAARRGISVNSASVKQNLEGSAISMGKDIQRLQQNAYLKANAMRTQAKVQQAYGKAALSRQEGESIANIIGSSYGLYSTAGGGK